MHHGRRPAALFGPPVVLDQGFGVCELCFQHATPREITNAAIAPPSFEVSEAVDKPAVTAGQPSGLTVVAFVLKV